MVTSSPSVTFTTWLSFSCTKLSSTTAALLAAALAKLTDGRTLAEAAIDGLGECSLGGVEVLAGAGGGVLVSALRSEAVRELVRDIGWECLIASRSFSIRSETSFSRENTSTGLAEPNGFERELEDAGAILGDERGLGLAELLFDRGRSSSFRRAS